MSNQVNSMNKGLTVKDLVTTGIFTALLFVFVLVGGVFFATNPVLTFFMPAGGGLLAGPIYLLLIATVYKGNIIKNLIMDCQSYTKYRPNETTGGIFVSWRRKEELPTGLD